MTNQNIVLPAIALRGTTILPGMIVHFDVSRECSINAVNAAMEEEGISLGPDTETAFRDAEIAAYLLNPLKDSYSD